MQLTWLDPLNEDSPFPPLEKVLDYPKGLLAAGGDLSITRLLKAYRSGIFPWYESDQPILWWSPDPRGILLPEDFRLSRSLRKTIRARNWQVTFDKCFHETIVACAQPRRYARGTWITRDMINAYDELFQRGYAHSVEVWSENYHLIGGLYGVCIGRMYFGESMFSRETDASKVAFAYLVAHLQKWGFPLIDCQLLSPHLASLGAQPMTRKEYLHRLQKLVDQPNPHATWEVDPHLDVAAWNPHQPPINALFDAPHSPIAPTD